MASKQPPTAEDAKQKALEQIQALQQKKLFQQELENQKRIHGIETDAQKKSIKEDQAAQKKILDEKKKIEKENTTAVAMANREIVKSISETLPYGFNKVLTSSADLFTKFGALGKGLSTKSVAETGIALLDFGIQIGNAAYTAAENNRLQKMQEAELERQFNAKKGTFDNFGDEMARLTHFLGPANEEIIGMSLAYSKLVQKTGEDAKITMRTWAEAAMPENLGENSKELLQRTLDIAKTAKTPGSYKSATAEIQDIMRGNLGAQLLRMGIHSKDIMAKYKELGGTENLTEIKANGMPENNQILADAILRMTHKEDMNASKATDPIQTLQQQIAKATMETAAGIMQYIYPVVKIIADWINHDSVVETEHNQKVKDLEDKIKAAKDTKDTDSAAALYGKLLFEKSTYEHYKDKYGGFFGGGAFPNPIKDLIDGMTDQLGLTQSDENYDKQTEHALQFIDRHIAKEASAVSDTADGKEDKDIYITIPKPVIKKNENGELEFGFSTENIAVPTNVTMRQSGGQ